MYDVMMMLMRCIDGVLWRLGSSLFRTELGVEKASVHLFRFGGAQMIPYVTWNT